MDDSVAMQTQRFYWASYGSGNKNTLELYVNWGIMSQSPGFCPSSFSSSYFTKSISSFIHAAEIHHNLHCYASNSQPFGPSMIQLVSMGHSLIHILYWLVLNVLVMPNKYTESSNNLTYKNTMAHRQVFSWNPHFFLLELHWCKKSEGAAIYIQ